MSESFWVKQRVVQQTLSFGISGEKNLETAVEQEAIHLVGAHAAPHAVGGFKDLKADGFFVKLARAGKTSQACPNDKNIRAGRHSPLHL